MALSKALEVDRIAVCDQIRDEVARILIEKMKWEKARVIESLKFYFEGAVWAPTPGRLQNLCRDPKDNMVVECAVNAYASVIVSGDNDLLALGSYHEIRMVTPREYISDF